MQADGKIDLKVLLMGAKYTGKTVLFGLYVIFTRLLDKQQDPQYKTTIGVQYGMKDTSWQLAKQDNEQLRIHFFDTGNHSIIQLVL